MIQRVYQQASKALLLDKVVVATDDNRIFNHVKEFGGEVVMTSQDHQTGTDRCVEALTLLGANHEITINIQGDEPFIQPKQIDLLIQFFTDHYKQFGIATLAKSLKDVNKLQNPNCVKLVFDNNKRAMYFSRYPIPFLREEENANPIKKHNYYKHIGLYIFKTSLLKELSKLPIGKLEKAESLEQLRWMQAGFPIGVCETHFESQSIDTPHDLTSLGY